MDISNQNNLLRGSSLDSKYFNPDYLFENGVIILKKFIAFITSHEVVNLGQTLLFLLAIFFITVILYTAVRLLEIRKKEHEHVHREIHEYAHNKAEQERRLHEDIGGSKNERWGITLNYLFSQHASDWKLAIIEADAMLEELLNQLGFKGENLGEKLKSADQESFPNLSIAWEIHTIRNRIAHEGLAFEFSQHEAKRVIALYEKIFHTYGYI